MPKRPYAYASAVIRAGLDACRIDEHDSQARRQCAHNVQWLRIADVYRLARCE